MLLLWCVKSGDSSLWYNGWPDECVGSNGRQNEPPCCWTKSWCHCEDVCLLSVLWMKRGQWVRIKLLMIARRRDRKTRQGFRGLDGGDDIEICYLLLWVCLFARLTSQWFEMDKHAKSLWYHRHCDWFNWIVRSLWIMTKQFFHFNTREKSRLAIWYNNNTTQSTTFTTLLSVSQSVNRSQGLCRSTAVQ